MKNRIIPLLVFWEIFCCALAFGQSEGEKLFKQVCVACHTIGKGKLIGPDLADVHKRRSEAWIVKFVRSSQTVIKSGDPVAGALFEEFNKILMPDHNFSDDQIRAIVAYIAENSSGGAVLAATGGTGQASGGSMTTAIRGNSRAGEKIFEGNTRLANGGPACASCHNITNEYVMAGGALAKDLTDAVSRLSEAGVTAILNNPPFPAMRQAYLNNPLTPIEISDLTAFLGQVDQIGASPQKINYGVYLFTLGLAGAMILIILLGAIWTYGKRNSVNQKIYDRQLKSI